MDLNTAFEIFFGVIATGLTTYALYFAYKHKDGTRRLVLSFGCSIRLTIVEDIIAQLRNWRAQDSCNLPFHHTSPPLAEGTYLRRRRRLFVIEEVEVQAHFRNETTQSQAMNRPTPSRNLLRA